MRAITDDMIHMLLERLSKRNITIWTEAGKIKYKAPAGALTSEELQCIKENKEKIIKYLENHAIWSKGVKETFPLTSIQKAYLIGSDQAYELGGINAHYYMELNCCDIDVVRFERAVNEVIARTDAMRTIVLSNGMQAVLEKVPTYKIERFEFGNEKDREEKREQWSHCVFDLCKWPLYNIRISYVNKAFPRIHIDFDCIIMDAWLPVEHTFGLIYFLLLPIYVGCRQVHMATSMFAENPLTWLEQINHYRATVTAGPNFAYQIVLNNMTENCHWDLSCLRYILNGGEPISKKNLHKFLDANKQYQLKENCLIPIYGMTETSGAVVLNVPYREPDIDTKQVDTGIDFDLKSIDILKNDLVCQGKTINGCSIRVVDDFNRDLGQMKVGNIQFKGEFLCKGYLNKDNKDLFADGWLCTGDIGFLSGQNLYIVGRKKDMFFMHGKNIYMRDIEQIIFERYGVRSAACGENNAMEEKSKIYLFMELEISSAEYTKKKKEIIMFIQGETGIKLSDVIFKDDMFMTQVGKFSKAELLKKYKKQNCPEVNS